MRTKNEMLKNLSMILPVKNQLLASICHKLPDNCPLDNILDCIRQSGLLDTKAYLEDYPDVREAGVDPLRHYIEHGKAEGRELNRIGRWPEGDTKEKDDTVLSCPHLRGTLVFDTKRVYACCAVNHLTSAVLERRESDLDFSIEEITRHRKELEWKLNNAPEGTACQGCVFVKPMPKIETSWYCKSLILGSCRFCNFRCVYCANVLNHRGDVELSAEMYTIAKKIIDNHLLSPTAEITIAGGEPFLMPDFEETVDLLNNYGKPNFLINTNLSTYSKAAARAIKKGNMLLRCSIDAGTPETFKKVKGRDAFHHVVGNIKKYIAIDPYCLILKYICLPENSNAQDMEGLLDILKLGIRHFFIDFDFNKAPTPEVMEFAGILKAKASLLGVEITVGYNTATNYDSGLDLAGHVEEACFAYYRSVSAGIKSSMQATEPVGRIGNIDYFLHNENGFHTSGWLWREESGGARKIMVFNGPNLINCGVSYSPRNDVSPGVRAGYVFKCPSKPHAREIYNSARNIEVFATFDNATWHKLPFDAARFVEA